MAAFEKHFPVSPQKCCEFFFSVSLCALCGKFSKAANYIGLALRFVDLIEDASIAEVLFLSLGPAAEGLIDGDQFELGKAL